MGTGEFHEVVEELDEVTDSLVVHLEDHEGGAGELLLFVVLREGAALDDALRGQLSPRHVPDAVEAVPAIARTLTGKKLELPVGGLSGRRLRAPSAAAARRPRARRCARRRRTRTAWPGRRCRSW
jgi:hypothetical protein